jgi:hypothetical protein
VSTTRFAFTSISNPLPDSVAGFEQLPVVALAERDIANTTTKADATNTTTNNGCCAIAALSPRL